MISNADQKPGEEANKRYKELSTQFNEIKQALK
jgi:hypothetical protein